MVQQGLDPLATVVEEGRDPAGPSLETHAGQEAAHSAGLVGLLWWVWSVEDRQVSVAWRWAAQTAGPQLAGRAEAARRAAVRRSAASARRLAGH